jgi:adenylate cyclase
MTSGTTLHILVQNASICELPLDRALELGRQRAGEPDPYRLLAATSDTPARLIIALQQDKDNVSRRHLTLTPLPTGLVRIANHSQIPLARDAGPAIAPGAALDLAPPFDLELAGRTLRVLPAGSADQHGICVLSERTAGPGSSELSLGSHSVSLLQPAQMRALLEGVPRALGVLQSAVGATDFLDRAAHALVQIVGLDTGRVLLRQGDRWDEAATHGTARNLPGWHPSRQVLDRLLRTRSTIWQHPGKVSDPDSASLRLLDTVVAAPLLDRRDEVIGILYGERRKDSPQAGRADTQVEAMLVNLLACGLATGLARLEQEKAAVQATALFEQFFTPDLARHLAADPRMLEGRETDVTVLFADVRAFSKHSEKLGAASAIRWMNDVLQELSACVMAEKGVLVDYVGDELMAMFGAPEKQPDHAVRAFRAGLAMHAALPALNARWEAILREPIRIGVGINSGTAQVGNTGSQIKFKYGPLGNTVNLASRVQGLTKYLRCGLLVTAATREQLDDTYIARRVVKTRVVNIEQPVDLFEVERSGDEERRTFFRRSQDALDALEQRNFAQAARAVGELLTPGTDDGPLLLILSRAADALIRAGQGFDPVWVPPGK